MMEAPTSKEVHRLSTSVILHTLICLEKVAAEQKRSEEDAAFSNGQYRKQVQSDQTKDTRVRRLTMLSSWREPPSLPPNQRPRSLTGPPALQREKPAVWSGDIKTSSSFWLPNLLGPETSKDARGGSAKEWAAELLRMNLLNNCLLVLDNSTAEQCVQVLCMTVLRKFLNLSPEASVTLLMNQPFSRGANSQRETQNLPCGLLVVLRSMQIHENSFDIQGEGAALLLVLLNLGRRDVSVKLHQLVWPDQRGEPTSKRSQSRGSSIKVLIRMIRRWKWITEDEKQKPRHCLSTFELQRCFKAHKIATQALAKIKSENSVELSRRELSAFLAAVRFHTAA
jgi:hypothetical protein